MTNGGGGSAADQECERDRWTQPKSPIALCGTAFDTHQNSPLAEGIDFEWRGGTQQIGESFVIARQALLIE